MSDYISRENAIAAAIGILEGLGYHMKHNERFLDEVEAAFEEVETADVVPVRHGRWKKVIEDDKYYHMECSRCCGRPLRSRWVDDAELSTFCPWCGALMDKDGDGDV